MLTRPTLPKRTLGRRLLVTAFAALGLNLTPVYHAPAAEPAPRLRPDTLGLVEAPRYPDQFLRAAVRSDLSARAKLIYAVLLSHWHHVRRDAWPSLATIAAEASVCKDTAIAAIYELEAHGWVRVRRRMRRCDRAENEPSSNLYTFDVDFGDTLERLALPAGDAGDAELRGALAELAQVRQELARLRAVVAAASGAPAPALPASSSSSASTSASSSSSSAPALPGLEGPPARLLEELEATPELRVLASADFARLLWNHAAVRGRSLAGALEALAELAEKQRARIAVKGRVWRREELADRALSFVGARPRQEEPGAPAASETARLAADVRATLAPDRAPGEVRPPRALLSGLLQSLEAGGATLALPAPPTGPPRPS